MANTAAPTRHEWLRPGSIALVFVGGCLGAAARELLSATVPGDVFPAAILIANLLGAFLLGLLLETLGRRISGPTSPRVDYAGARLRLLLGTGALGGFTTYSALAFATVALTRDGEPWLALAYALGTLIVGALATAAGIAAAARRRPWGSTAGEQSDA